MKATPNDMQPFTLYTTRNNGDLHIVKYHNNKQVDVLFPSTGYTTTVSSTQIRSGNVKDLLYPRVCGVGFLGEGKYSRSTHSNIYVVWTNMINRCYNESSQYHTYKDCTVAKEWHNFQTFAAWFEENHPLPTSGKYHLDKDTKIKGNTIYSPSTCVFITGAANIAEATAKDYTFVNPEGEVVEVHNLLKFAREQELKANRLYQLAYGNIDNADGWTRLN